MERVQREDSCWIFTGMRNEHGYGVLYVGMDVGKRLRRFAHRVSYEIFTGAIPTDKRYEIHHLCDVPACVNPEHLRMLTRSEHARLNEQFTRATCVNGHPRTPENIYITRDGHRDCRVCGREKAKAKRHAAGLKGGPGAHNRAKTHCASGHPYDDQNTTWLRGGGRACRECRREACRRYRARKRV